MAHLSLPKTNLLRKPREYRRVYNKGKRLQGNNFSLIFVQNGKNRNRLGISIHSQLKGAVKRNRIKRVIREFYRLNRTFLQLKNAGECIKPAMDIVFTVRKNFNLNSPADVKHAVNILFNGKQGE